MARCTCEHARLAGFHQLELAQFEGVLVDHALGDAVAVVARLDAVDLVAQLVGELRDIGEAAQAAVVDVLGNRQGVLGALQVGAQRLDRAFLGVLLDVVGHGGHPVAQEYVEVVVGQGAVGHRHREQIDLGLVAEGLEDLAGDRGGHCDVGPADVGETHRRTGFGLRGLGCQRCAQRHGQQPRLATFHSELLCRVRRRRYPEGRGGLSVSGRPVAALSGQFVNDHETGRIRRLQGGSQPVQAGSHSVPAVSHSIIVVFAGDQRMPFSERREPFSFRRRAGADAPRPQRFPDPGADAALWTWPGRWRMRPAPGKAR